MSRDDIVSLARVAGFETALFNSVDGDEVVVNGKIITDELVAFSKLLMSSVSYGSDL